jgi:hypothetical protein
MTHKIFFGGCQDNGYVPMLEGLITQKSGHKIILIPGQVDMAAGIKALNIPALHIPDLFEETRISGPTSYPGGAPPGAAKPKVVPGPKPSPKPDSERSFSSQTSLGASNSGMVPELTPSTKTHPKPNSPQTTPLGAANVKTNPKPKPAPKPSKPPTSGGTSLGVAPPPDITQLMRASQLLFGSDESEVPSVPVAPPATPALPPVVDAPSVDAKYLDASIVSEP